MNIQRDTRISPYMAFWWQGDRTLSEEAVVTWLNGQRVLPLFVWRAQQRGWTLPPTFVDAARKAQYHEQAQQMMAERQLRALGEVAHALDIPLVLVKGASVAQVYPRSWMRTYTDIDLLVSEEDVSQFLPAVFELGYTRLESVAGQRGEHLPPLAPKGTGVKLEIHTALAREAGRELFTIEQWKPRLQTCQAFPGLWVPDSMDHALYMVHHGIVHHEFTLGLLPFIDLELWTRSWEHREWQQLSDRASAIGLHRATCLALALTMWVEDTHWPEELRSLFPVPPSDILTIAQQSLISGRALGIPHVWRDLPDRSVRGLLKYTYLVLSGDPRMRRHLPFKDRVGFYVRRPFQLLRNYGPTLWRLVCGERTMRESWQTGQRLQSWLQEAEKGSEMENRNSC